MSKPTPAATSILGGDAVRNFYSQTWRQDRLWRKYLQELSREARARLKRLDWHHGTGTEKRESHLPALRHRALDALSLAQTLQAVRSLELGGPFIQAPERAAADRRDCGLASIGLAGTELGAVVERTAGTKIHAGEMVVQSDLSPGLVLGRDEVAGTIPVRLHRTVR